jgi:PAS domain S-box-containing protein
MKLPLRVLIVDDSEDDAVLLATALRQGGYAPDFKVVQTEEAMQTALADADWDLIVSDFALPNFSAPAALAVLQQTGQDVPFIAVSGAVGEEMAASILRAGAHDFILKGNLARLAPAVERELREARMRQERRQAEVALRASEERFRALTENAQDLIALLAPDGTLHYASPSVQPMLGYQPEELVGRNILDFVLPEERDDIAARLLCHAGQANPAAAVELHIHHRDGSWRVLSGTGQVWRPLTGEVRVVVNAHDITERQRAERAEREQRVMAEALRDTAAALTRTLDFNNVLDRVLENVGRVVPNDNANIMLLEGETCRVARRRGYEEHTLDAWLRGQPFSIGSLANFRRALKSARVEVTPDTRLSPGWDEHTETAWIRSAITAPICAHGQVIGFLNLDSVKPGFFNSAHAEHLQAFADQAAIAIENAQLYQTLEQQTAELGKLYRASADLVAAGSDVAGLARQIASAITREYSFAHCSLFLLDEAGTAIHCVGQAGDIQIPDIPPMPLDGPGLPSAALRSGEMIYAPDVRAEPRYCVGDDRIRSEFVIPLRPHGRTIGVFNLESPDMDGFDAVARRALPALAERAALALENAQLLERLNRALQAAEEANRVKSEFLAVTSHELRTPLTSILGALGIVLEDLCDTPEEERYFLESAKLSAHHLLFIVNAILDAVQLEAGRMELTPQPLDVTENLRAVCENAQALAQRKGIRLELDLPGDTLPLVQVDPLRTQQILNNLLDNAVKFTEHGQILVSVRLNTESAQVKISVQDTGIGIPAPVQEKLFQPFVQADGSTTRRYGGNGLGLSISRRLAELMGGTLTLHSAGQDQGATFVLALPIA